MKDRPQTERVHGGLPKGFRHQGTTYDLDHLRAYTTTFTRSAKDKLPSVTFKVEVSFSSHCFTRGLPAADTPYDESLLFTDSGDVRLFDPRRWSLSKSLPGIIGSLPERACRHTGRSNFFTVALADEDGNTVEYEVFFRVRKTRPGHLWLLVESAYVREPGYLTSRPTGGRIGFLVLLHNTLQGKKIRP